MISKILVISSVLCLLAHNLQSVSRDERILLLSQAIETYGSILNSIDKKYLFEVDIKNLSNIALDAIFKNLDPYSFFIENSYNPNFLEKEITEDLSKSIGLEIVTNRQNKNSIIVFSNSPAQLAGLLPGDEIIRINEIDVQHLSGDKIVNILNQEDPINLSVRRIFDILHTVINKGESNYKRKSIIYSCLINKTGYIKLVDFNKGSALEAVEILNSFDKNCNNFIIDLRGNNGGLVDEVIELLSYFLSPDSLVIKVINRHCQVVEEYHTFSSTSYFRKPIIVIIDKHTASAAEIFAGCIQDYDRGIIIGERSFGKGTIQTIENILYDKKLKLTTAQYFLPSGRAFFHEQKFKSDVEYRSMNGRKLCHYNCGGMVPDVFVKKNSDPVLLEIIDSGLINQYAKLYYRENKKKVNINNFKISDQIFNKFINWLLDYENYWSYNQYFDKLKEYLEKNNYGLNAIGHINLCRSQINKIKYLKLRKLKAELKTLIEQEIIEQYYMIEGKIQFSLINDKFVQKAINYLQDKEMFNATLSSS